MFRNLKADPKFSCCQEKEPAKRTRPSNMTDRQTRPNAASRKLELSKLEEEKPSEDDEFIGFATLPDQVHRKAVKRGFEFSFMVVGETGLGKSTLINSLFLTDLYKDRKFPTHILDNAEQTTDIERKQLEIEEKGVKVRLSVVDTPGFSEALNGDESWKPIIDYVDRQFEQYYQAESGVNRKNIQDSRVHCCLYFISPYGHGLKPIDIFMMKKLHHKVNIIPLIAKSDTLTPKEKARLKSKILDQIEENQLDIYKFPECDSDEDEEFKEQDKELKAAIPFAVVGSNTVVEVAGKKVRGRMYQWGIVEVENPAHCDFVKLRQMLISTHMQDLKDITSDIHYENYRAEHLEAQMKHSTRERTKLKRESMMNLGKLEDTDNLIAQKDAEIQRMQEMLAKMQAQLQTSPRTAVNGT
uniref:Septin n=1 Tax=Crassostrea virginica TaxID=6565 RepID=A0A8B8EIR1_CRAVI|nr:septin-2-like isoform X2 [Crassostrea virginica]